MEDSCVLFSALDKLGNNAVSTVCFFVVFFQSDLKIFVSGGLERVCGVFLLHVSGLGCLKLG